MAISIHRVGQRHSPEEYDPVVMQLGASYIKLIAERHLRKLREDEIAKRCQADELQFEFCQDLSELSKAFEVLIEGFSQHLVALTIGAYL